MIEERILLQIDDAIHSSVEDVTIGDMTIPISKAHNGCRYVDYAGVRFMEQNKEKPTIYGARAKAGWKITWGIRSNGPWYLISQGKVERNP